MSEVHVYPRYHRRNRPDEIGIGGVAKRRLESTEVRPPQLATLTKINAPRDLTITVGRAFTERSRGDAVPVLVRGPASPSPGPASVGGLWVFLCPKKRPQRGGGWGRSLQREVPEGGNRHDSVVGTSVVLCVPKIRFGRRRSKRAA
jgi:hypothetical protein